MKAGGERACSKCGTLFISRSNTRFQCYVCRPQHKGKKASEMSVAAVIRGESPELDKMLRLVEAQLLQEGKSLDLRNQPPPSTAEPAPQKDSFFEGLRPREYGRVARNKLGHTVFWHRRPMNGWGECFFKTPFPRTKAESTRCHRERFSKVSSYCYQHLEWWSNRRAEIMAERVTDEELAMADPFDESAFKVENPKEAVKFLSRINYYVYKGWLDPIKARVLRETIMNQVRVIQESMGGPKPLLEDDRTPEEIKQDAELAADLKRRGEPDGEVAP